VISIRSDPDDLAPVDRQRPFDLGPEQEILLQDLALGREQVDLEGRLDVVEVDGADRAVVGEGDPWVTLLPEYGDSVDNLNIFDIDILVNFSWKQPFGPIEIPSINPIFDRFIFKIVVTTQAPLEEISHRDPEARRN